MTILGIRCSPKEFSYSVIEGNQRVHKLIHSCRIKFPNGYSHSELLKWFYHEIAEILKKHEISAVGVKGTEALGMKGKSYGERMELEGMIFLQASMSGIKYAKRKVSGTIAKDLGLKGKGKYLEDGFDYSAISNFKEMSDHLQEATQVALSMAK
jgi:hypothetical protein